MPETNCAGRIPVILYLPGSGADVDNPSPEELKLSVSGRQVASQEIHELISAFVPSVDITGRCWETPRKLQKGQYIVCRQVCR